MTVFARLATVAPLVAADGVIVLKPLPVVVLALVVVIGLSDSVRLPSNVADEASDRVGVWEVAAGC